MTEPLFEPDELGLFSFEEQAQFDGIARAGNNTGGDLAKIALVLGAAFILYRSYMKRRVKEELGDQEPTPSALADAMAAVWQSFVPRWVTLTAPPLIAGYVYGAQNAKAGSVPEEWLAELASVYAHQLGTHINEVSADAVARGFQAQLNRKVPARVAANNVVDAWGVPPSTMRALNGLWAAEDQKITSETPGHQRKRDRARNLISNAIRTRSKAIGETEAYASRGNGKAVLWMWAQQRGVIPYTATKKWITADDERVCPSCGPLHEMEVPVTEQFHTAMGDVYAPGIHVNCRCDMELVIPVRHKVYEAVYRAEAQQLEGTGVSKGYGDDPYNRDRRGRFARIESRTRQPQVKVRQRDPVVDDAMRQLSEYQREKADVDAIMAFLEGSSKLNETTKLTPSIKLSPGTKLTPITHLESDKTSLSRTGLPKHKLDIRVHDETQLLKEQPTKLAPNKIWLNSDSPLFGIFPPRGIGENVYIADGRIKFYEGPNSDFGPSGLKRGVEDYWDEAVFKRIEHLMAGDPRYDEDSATITVETDDGIYSIDSSAYLAAWDSAISNLGPTGTRGQPSGMDDVWVDVLVRRHYGGDKNNAYRAEREEMSAYEIASMLGIHEDAFNLRPTVGMVNKVNDVDTDVVTTYADGVHVYKNPGKWRIMNEVRSASGADADYPYRLVFMEPEDLVMEAEGQ